MFCNDARLCVKGRLFFVNDIGVLFTQGRAVLCLYAIVFSSGIHSISSQFHSRPSSSVPSPAVSIAPLQLTTSTPSPVSTTTISALSNIPQSSTELIETPNQASLSEASSNIVEQVIDRDPKASGSDSPPSCTTAEGVSGKCQDLSNCPSLLLDLTKLRQSICFKSLFVPGVCCPVDKNSVGNAPSSVPR